MKSSFIVDYGLIFIAGVTFIILALAEGTNRIDALVAGIALIAVAADAFIKRRSTT
jgi:hypothetical protein